MHKTSKKRYEHTTTLTFGSRDGAVSGRERVDDNKRFASSGLSSLSYHNKVVFSLYRLQHITRTLYHCSIIGEKLGYGMG